MPAQELRDYQTRGRAGIFHAFGGGARRVLVVSPTGSGKTTIFTFVADELDQVGKRTLILVHRRELAYQACNRLREFGVGFGLVMSGEPSAPYHRVQVASVPTLSRRIAAGERVPDADLVVADEAHLSTAETWARCLARYRRARVVGFTATPWRLSGKPLVGLYDEVVVVAHPAELREQGHLCPYVGFSYKAPDLAGVKVIGGEYNERQTAAKMRASVIVDNVVEMWLARARELSTVVFAVTVEHSQELTAKFRAAGVRAEHLDGTTPLLTRKAILARVERGETQVLCNVGVAVEGIDIPRLKCCVLARPTKSVARAIQMMGRVRRPWNGVTARIHDHAFVITQHGEPDTERDYALAARPEVPKSLKTCPECLAIYSGPACPECGAEREPEPAGERVLRTVKDGELVELDSAKPTVPVARPPVKVRWDAPKVVEGQYTRTWSAVDTYGPRRWYTVEGKREYELPGTHRLDFLMSHVPAGAPVRVEYLGEVDAGGGRFPKEFSVRFDDGT
jgi:DNA repair protein RadD